MFSPQAVNAVPVGAKRNGVSPSTNAVIPVYNSTIKLLGKHSFGDAKLTIRDDASGIVSRKVGEQLQKQFDFFEQAGAASGIDYKFRMRVEMLDLELLLVLLRDPHLGQYH